MGYNQRNDEIRDNIERMRREREAYEDALATVEQFNARLMAKKSAWFWPRLDGDPFIIGEFVARRRLETADPHGRAVAGRRRRAAGIFRAAIGWPEGT